ncbi:hypothetical protein B0H67DRAFT_444140, partial [Lasiosphaeris hirsuta]
FTSSKWSVPRYLITTDFQGIIPATAQMVLRQEADEGVLTKEEKELVELLEQDEVWEARLKRLALRGVRTEHISHWAWILSAPTADQMVGRFTSSETRHPLFVFKLLMERRNNIRKTESFMALLTYIHKHHARADRVSTPSVHDDDDGGSVPRLKLLDMSSTVFEDTIRQLVNRALQFFPSSLPAISHLTVAFIQGMPSKVRESMDIAIKERAFLMNQVLIFLGRAALDNPLHNMSYNWDAQKVLLGVASRIDHPMQINQEAYRAIKGVLGALRKNPLERKVAERAAKTWPPYQLAFDGRDEGHSPEDSLSRSVKAGVLAREAGYESNSNDRATDALGGSIMSLPPTIQTRALRPHVFTGGKANLNAYIHWAAQITATRNAREAWHVFTTPAQPSLQPTSIVYAEIFKKLFAKNVEGSLAVLPGDVREVFPTYDGNLSQYELARLAPPPPDELYHRMLQSGIRPTGECLVVLVKHATSKEKAIQYLSDSPYSEAVQSLLAPSSTVDSGNKLTEIPPRVFNAWIAMLCSNHSHPDENVDARKPSFYIQEAILLATLYQRDSTEPYREKAPWRSILEALCTAKTLYADATFARWNQAEESKVRTLFTFVGIYERIITSHGNDAIMFGHLCRMLLKMLRLQTFKDPRTMTPHLSPSPNPAVNRILIRMHKIMRRNFLQLTQPLEYHGTADGNVLSFLPHKLSAIQVFHYMFALGALKDTHGMVELMHWVLDGWEEGGILEEAKHPRELGYDYIIRTFSYFESYGERAIDPDAVLALQAKLEMLRVEKNCAWFWPIPTGESQEVKQALAIAHTWPQLREHMDFTYDREALYMECRQKRNISVDVPRSTLTTPRSQHDGFMPPFPHVKEWIAVNSLMAVAKAQEAPDAADFIEFELNDFSFYTSRKGYECDMRPLQQLSTKLGASTFYVDGVLSLGATKHYIKRVEITELPIGNYGVAFSTVRENIWVRSKSNSKTEVYYRLNNPSVEYARYHGPFLWIADLAKHVVDYCAAEMEKNRDVGLHSFKQDFIHWLSRTHHKSQSFRKWRQQHPSPDFRTAIMANIEFIWKEVHVGDTISTPRDDDETTDTKWRAMASKGSVVDSRWFGLVQKIHISEWGKRSFDVTWFYRPVETPCCLMKYPWPNELFLSDHCTCEGGASGRVKEEQILAVHAVDWFGDPETLSGDFFVRQTYMVDDRRWVTLKRSHMMCAHERTQLEYTAGDTVLASPDGDDIATPFEVLKIFKQNSSIFVRLRELVSRRIVDPSARNAAPNELVYTNRLIVTKLGDIFGKCTVRFFRPDEPIPSPYNRGGTGNLFFITHQLVHLDGKDEIAPLDNEPPSSLRQGFDPVIHIPKLKGLDLFCGAGNFGRGLEDGGVVDMRWANDIWDKAIHTYMANTNEKTTSAFLGSVDDLLRAAIEERYDKDVPRPGEVDFISAGSPCPGFSLLTQDKTTLTQVKNQSLVASFASFVDFYRPKYGVLENVSGIVSTPKNRSEDVLSQLFCAIIGMGYQAQLILGDAWSHGAPQTRTRVFLYFADPYHQLPEAPMLSHSHFNTVKSRGLGELCNGEPFVRRSFVKTAFKYVSAAEGTGDLPPIQDSRADCCIAFPDHRVVYGMTDNMCQQIKAIPTHPFGQNFSKAWREGRGVMLPGDRELFPPAPSARTTAIAKGWSRLDPHGLFQTVTTRSQPTDARNGSGLHWSEDRPLSLQEVRRAQGFLDEEVLVGGPPDQWKLVGNSVARQMALALGLKFREAW